MTAPLNKLSPEFEKATGHKLSIHFDSTPNIIARVNAGTPFDAVVVPVDVFKDAAARARAMTIEEIHARLDHRFRFLTGGSRSGLPKVLRNFSAWSERRSPRRPVCGAGNCTARMPTG